MLDTIKLKPIERLIVFSLRARPGQTAAQILTDVGAKTPTYLQSSLRTLYLAGLIDCAVDETGNATYSLPQEGIQKEQISEVLPRYESQSFSFNLTGVGVFASRHDHGVFPRHSCDRAGLWQPRRFLQRPAGSPIVGSFSFDPSLDTVDRGVLNQFGEYAAFFTVPVTITLQDVAGSLTESEDWHFITGQGIWEYRGIPTRGYLDWTQIIVANGDGIGYVTLTLPAGSLGDDMFLSQFPWGTQPVTVDGCADLSHAASTCSYGNWQTSSNSGLVYGDVYYTVDAVSFTPFSLNAAPEPGSFGLLLTGVMLAGCWLSSIWRRKSGKL
jgi:hypothetical protein